MTNVPQAAPKVIFLHVSKTGGTTFRRILQSIYGNRFRLMDDSAIPAIKAALNTLDCLEFHLSPREDTWVIGHEELLRKNRLDLLAGTQVFTMLRDPVDQFISRYFYLRSIRANVEPILAAQGIAFPETIEGLLDQPGACNAQLAFLAGKPQRSGRSVTAGDLADVKRMLLDLDVHVGVLERFADSMHIFETVTGRRIPDGVIRDQNRSSDRSAAEAVSPAIREIIRERSALDIELYRFGRELFLEDLARCGPAPAYRFVPQQAEGKAAIASVRKPAKSPSVPTGVFRSVFSKMFSKPGN